MADRDFEIGGSPTFKQRYVEVVPGVYALGVSLLNGAAAVVSGVEGAVAAGDALATSKPVTVSGTTSADVVRTMRVDADGRPLIGLGGTSAIDGAVAGDYIGPTNAAGGAVRGFNVLPVAMNAAGTFDRQRSAPGAANSAGIGLLGNGLLGYDGGLFQLVGVNNTGAHWLQVGARSAAPALSDIETNAPSVAANPAGTALHTHAYGLLYNGNLWERQRGNVETLVVSRAAATTSYTGSDRTNNNGRGIIGYLGVTVNPGAAETLTFALQVKDEAGGDGYVTVVTSGAIAVFGSGAAATGLEVICAYPGAVETTGLTGWTSQALFLPRTYRWLVTHSAAGAWTYTVADNLGL